MELANPETIAVLCSVPMASAQRDPRPSARKPAAARGRSRRCECGHCRQCLENARWERIFQEKFADPNYYAGLVVRTASPVTSF